MSVNVSIDAITLALVTRISLLVAAPPAPLTTALPLRQVSRYVGDEFKDEEQFRRGIAGRCPAVRVRYAGTRFVRRVMSCRRDRVETTFGIVCCTDSHMRPGGRQALMSAIELIRHTISARRFGLQIDPIKAQTIGAPMQDDEALLAYVIAVTARHWTDYSIDPGLDVMESATGDVHVPNTADADGRVLGEVDIPLNQESA